MLFSAPLRIALGFWGAAHCSWMGAALLFAAEDLLPFPLGITLPNMAVMLGYGLVWGGRSVSPGGRRTPPASPPASAPASSPGCC